jgi:hypothetical protein
MNKLNQIPKMNQKVNKLNLLKKKKIETLEIIWF